VQVAPGGGITVGGGSSRASRLDGCMHGVLSRLALGKPRKPEGGTMMISFTSDY
jgi:hypothetical protein